MTIKKGKAICYGAFIMAVLGVILFLLVWNGSKPSGYVVYNSETVTYDRGTVSVVTDEDLQRENDRSDRFLGTQTVTVRMKSGDLSGREIEVSNVLSTEHNIYLQPGDNVIIKVDKPEGIELFYSIYNYDRTVGVAVISLIFILMLVLVGKTKGVRSTAGLLFTLFFIVRGLLPMLYHGYSPILCCFLTIIITSTVCLVLLTGLTKKTLLNLGAVLLGTAIVSVFYIAFTGILHLSGYNFDEAEELLLISQNTGLNISELLFVGVMISTLGAVMDMTMSISSPLFEMKQLKPEMTFRDLVTSGFTIGKDMSGTMSQTLILAFIGSSLTAMLVLTAYGVQFNQFLSSNYMAIEFLHGIIGGVSVVISIPVSVILSAWFLEKRRARRTAKK